MDQGSSTADERVGETTDEYDRRHVALYDLERQRDEALDLAAVAVRWAYSPKVPKSTAELREWHRRLLLLERAAGRHG